jgi:hypothetical protein
VSTPEPAGYGLVMPFVVCASQGGPHEDGAFVSGYECGQLDTLLQQGNPPRHEGYYRTDSIPQIDLIAMRHGYVMSAKPWDDHPDQWTFVELVKGPPIDDGEGSKE